VRVDQLRARRIVRRRDRAIGDRVALLRHVGDVGVVLLGARVLLRLDRALLDRRRDVDQEALAHRPGADQRGRVVARLGHAGGVAVGQVLPLASGP
jgi:hypothetical protein